MRPRRRHRPARAGKGSRPYPGDPGIGSCRAVSARGETDERAAGGSDEDRAAGAAPARAVVVGGRAGRAVGRDRPRAGKGIGPEHHDAPADPAAALHPGRVIARARAAAAAEEDSPDRGRDGDTAAASVGNVGVPGVPPSPPGPAVSATAAAGILGVRRGRVVVAAAAGVPGGASQVAAIRQPLGAAVYDRCCPIIDVAGCRANALAFRSAEKQGARVDGSRCRDCCCSRLARSGPAPRRRGSRDRRRSPYLRTSPSR